MIFGHVQEIQPYESLWKLRRVWDQRGKRSFILHLIVVGISGTLRLSRKQLARLSTI